MQRLCNEICQLALKRLGDFSLRSGALNVPVGYTAINPANNTVVPAGQPIPGRNLANLRLNGQPVGVTPNGAAIAAVYTAMEGLAVAYSDTPTTNNATFQQPNPFDYREDNIRIDYPDQLPNTVSMGAT
jgi:hypothetical protein